MSAGAAHVPVMLAEVLEALEPIAGGTFIDATFGAGGYARALLERGAAQVIGIDRDPEALAAGRPLAEAHPDRLLLVEGEFAELEALARTHARAAVDGIVLDLGVSSMQLDRPERGFSFRRDGPLDMRMSKSGPTAADLVNRADERTLADILFHFGEERAARRIARTVVAARADAPIDRTGRLAELVSGCLPRPRPGQIHPATRTFQALRIAVNDELGQLVRALAAAEAVLAPGGRLVVVTFHSLEDRIVKRYLRVAAGREMQGSRHTPARATPAPPRYRRMISRTPGQVELEANPRARSARLRAALRTEAPPVPLDAALLGLPRAPLAAELAPRGRR